MALTSKSTARWKHLDGRHFGYIKFKWGTTVVTSAWKRLLLSLFMNRWVTICQKCSSCQVKNQVFLIIQVGKQMLITKLDNHVGNFYFSIWQLDVLYLCEKKRRKLRVCSLPCGQFWTTNFGHVISWPPIKFGGKFEMVILQVSFSIILEAMKMKNVKTTVIKIHIQSLH